MEIKNATTDSIPALRLLWKEAFGDTDEFLDIFFGTAFSIERSLCITEKESICAALYWFECEHKEQKIAYIYAVATAKAHRGKGLCTMLMDAAHSTLLQQGFKGAVLVPASDGLFDMYEKMGYKICSFTNEFETLPQEDTVYIKEITKDEYSVLRREYLPDNAVIQENENLDFLCRYTTFFRGEDFLLTAYTEEDVLICREILGNIEKAPKIVRTLNCRKGIFRTAGCTKPFAMYYDLSAGNYPAPSYFAHAFD